MHLLDVPHAGGGENPHQLYRKEAIRFASEDIEWRTAMSSGGGAAYQACHFLGMPGACAPDPIRSPICPEVAPKSMPFLYVRGMQKDVEKESACPAGSPTDSPAHTPA